MCGIYGMVSINGDPLRHPETATDLFSGIRHRGPDGHGEHRQADAILGAARLWIIDRRPKADQPYTSPSGRTLVCNGEIYNGFQIRSRFPNYPYQTRTDIEPILPLVDSRGASGLRELDGMFSVALWDTRTKCLWLARDHSGEKPLFYARFDNEVWFASEVQSLLAGPRFSRALDQTAVTDYLAFGCVRPPLTMHAEIRQVRPGHLVRFTSKGTVETPIAHTGGSDPTLDAGRHTARALDTALDLAVRKQTRADVPVGVFLSGGIDSSLITALATSQQSVMHSYTVRFPQLSYDEGASARRVAAAFATCHHEVHATFDELGRALEILIRRVAEPLSDPAVLPTILLAQRARDEVGVVLSGEGSDELFGGYPTYLGHRWAPAVAVAPAILLDIGRRLLATRAASGRRVPLSLLADRFLALAASSPRVRHLSWFGTGLFPYLPAIDRERILDSLEPCTDPVEWAMRTDYHTNLSARLLPKLDRATMLWSLEARAPFLDRGVRALARGVPASGKVSLLRSKIPLRDAAAIRLPAWVLRRRKQGLSVPIAGWLNGALRDTVHRTLDPGRIANQGIFPELPLSRLMQEHHDRRVDHSRALWPLVIFQLWLENWEGERV